MCWRPDGKLLSLGYECGKVILLDVESDSVLRAEQFDGPVSSLGWIEGKRDEVPSSKKYDPALNLTFLPLNEFCGSGMKSRRRGATRGPF